MAKQLQQRRGTTAQHSTFTGAVAEITVDTTKSTAVVHDGATAGGIPLAREAMTVQKDSNTGAAYLPSGTSAQRPVLANGVYGIRMNTDLGVEEFGLGTTGATTWTSLQNQLISGTSIKTIGGINALGAGDIGVVTSASSVLTGAPTLNGTLLQTQSYRNRIINGDMSVNQIYGTNAVTPTASTYIADQYAADITQASKLTFQQVADAPSGFKYSTKITVATQYAPLAPDAFTFRQSIEGQNIIDFQLGTSGAVTLVTSNWIKGSVAGVYSISVGNPANNRSYVGTINVTTSWTKVSITLIGDTTGVWPTDNTTGLIWRLDLGSGTNYNATSGVWNNGVFSRTPASVTFVNQPVGSTLSITGLQLEKVPTGATTGTDYEFLPYDENLRRCQRYLPVISGNPVTTVISHGGALTTSVTAIVNFKMPANLRVPITGITLSSPTHFTIYNGAINMPPSNMAVYSSTKESVSISATVSGATVGQSALVLTNNILATILFTGAQL